MLLRRGNTTLILQDLATQRAGRKPLQIIGHITLRSTACGRPSAAFRELSGGVGCEGLSNRMICRQSKASRSSVQGRPRHSKIERNLRGCLSLFHESAGVTDSAAGDDLKSTAQVLSGIAALVNRVDPAATQVQHVQAGSAAAMLKCWRCRGQRRGRRAGRPLQNVATVRWFREPVSRTGKWLCSAAVSGRLVLVHARRRRPRV